MILASFGYETSIISSPLDDNTPVHKLTEVQLDVYRYIFGEVSICRALSNSTISEFTAKLVNGLKGE